MIGELVELELRALGAEPDGRRVAVIGAGGRAAESVRADPRAWTSRACDECAESTVRSARHGENWLCSGASPVTPPSAGSRSTGSESDIDWSRSLAKTNRVGSGRTLIEQSLPFQLDAQTRLDIGPDDVRCVVTMAVD